MRGLSAIIIAAAAGLSAGAAGNVRAQAPTVDPATPAQCVPLNETVETIGAAALAAGAPGLVVGISRPGRPPLIRAWGRADVELDVPLTEASVFRIASLTKQFTAALVLDLVSEGSVALDDRVRAHLPEHDWLGEITIYQLLVQTSGLPDYASDPAGEASKASPRTSEEMMAWIGRLAARPDFAPGERWAYSNSNYIVLGALVERVTGQSFEAALTSRVLSPAGLGATVVDDPRDLVLHRVRGYGRQQGQLMNAAWIHPSMPGPAGSLRSTAGDLLRWNEALHSGGILSDDILARMTGPGRLGDGRSTRFGMPQAWQDGLRADYAMGLFVSDSELGSRVWHSGDIEGFVTWMAHYPNADVTIVILQNADFLDVDHGALERLVAADRLCEAG